MRSRNTYLAALCFVLLPVIVLTTSSLASAALPEALGNVAGNTFAATSSEGEFIDPASGLAIKCKKAKATGELTGPKTGTGTTAFEKCSIGGLSALSLGDKGGTVLIAGTGTLCYIDKATKLVGILIALPAGGVHIEIPALGQLLVITGSIVGEVKPINTSTTTGTYTDRRPNPRCEGTVEPEDELFIELEHDATPLRAELSREVAVTFAKEVEVMA